MTKTFVQFVCHRKGKRNFPGTSFKLVETHDVVAWVGSFSQKQPIAIRLGILEEVGKDHVNTGQGAENHVFFGHSPRFFSASFQDQGSKYWLQSCFEWKVSSMHMM